MPNNYPCAIVDYQANNRRTLIARALMHQGVLILTHLPDEFKQDLSTIYQYGDEIFNRVDSHQLNASAYPRKLSSDTVNAVTERREGIGNCLWGNRIFATYDPNDIRESKENLPLIPGVDGESITSAYLQYNKLIHSLFGDALKTLESELKLQPKALTRFITGRSSMNLTRYVPVTQSRIRDSFKDGKLCVAEDNTLFSMVPHCDISPLVAINYRHSKHSGLQLLYNGTWCSLPLLSSEQELETSLIIFSGRQLELLTNGHVRPVKHRVIITPSQQERESMLPPDKMRFLAASYMMYSGKVLSPSSTLLGGLIEPPSGQTSPYLHLVGNSGKFLIKEEALFNLHFGRVTKSEQLFSIKSEKQLETILKAYPAQSVYDQCMQRRYIKKETHRLLVSHEKKPNEITIPVAANIQSKL